MAPRKPQQARRPATPLELFFDLVFVVAVATAAADLHHGIADDHAVDALLGYALAFFGIWWAWVNFTWFASAHDCDDVPYRLLVFVQMTGALIFASGVSELAAGDRLVAISGYVVMRVGLVGQWLRAAANDAVRRKTILRYATGVLLVQVGWVALVFLPEELARMAVLLGVVAELAIPAWAESAEPTPWHPHHIAERYGLFTIIVLGESVLAATGTIASALDGEGWARLLPTIAGGLLLLYSMWWLYFQDESHTLLSNNRRAFVWGYAHYFVFGAAAAVGAGFSVVSEAVTGHAAIGVGSATWAVAIPVAIYVLCLRFLMDRGHGKPLASAPGPIVAIVVLLTPLVLGGVLTMGLVLVAYVALRLIVAATPPRAHS